MALLPRNTFEITHKRVGSDIWTLLRNSINDKIVYYSKNPDEVYEYRNKLLSSNKEKLRKPIAGGRRRPAEPRTVLSKSWGQKWEEL